MPSVVNFAEYLKNTIQAGQSIEGNVVKVIADNGNEIGDAVFKVINGGNGVSSNVGVAVQSGTTGATTTGLGYLAMDVGTVGAALAPAFGVLAGVGLYNLAPEFWTDLSNALVNAGQTIGGKVIAYWDGDNINFSEETIEIYKNAMLEAGVFEVPENIITEDDPVWSEFEETDHFPAPYTYVYGRTPTFDGLLIQGEVTGDCYGCWYKAESPVGGCKIAITFSDVVDNAGLTDDGWYYVDYEGERYNYKIYWGGYAGDFNASYPPVTSYGIGYQSQYRRYLAKNVALSVLAGNDLRNENLQPDATYPDGRTLPNIYPGWLPWEYPVTLPDPSALPKVYPTKYPGTAPDPEPTQEPAQNPEPEPYPVIMPVINPDFPLPQPNPDPGPEPTPDPDPDPQPDPDPIPEPDKPIPDPDPSNPNPDPTPSPSIPVGPLPSTVSSNKLFTVYNPTGAQLDALGAYLWDGSIIAAIRDIWQEPLDGVISLQQVYVTPPTSGSHNIILGFLDSGVSSLVVSNQFVTVDCGSVTVPENKENATDYAPYTSLHLYLPFIGIVELDTNECMKSSINVKYMVDVYTGTCLATVSVTRTEDMPNSPILYTYSGNCSQQLPLTSGNATGMLSALIGGITAGLSVASGGGLGVLAGAQIAGQSLTHEMFHVSHSGNISSNAGIMGNKKPYLIIGRRHCYDANNYNALYGYPANKTVILGNHTGYVKVKKCFLKTAATTPEHDQILALLSTGVIL